MKELVLEAVRTNLPKVQAFIGEQLKAAGCPGPVKTAIDIAVEELFVNIASYAYAPDTGTAVIQVSIKENPPAVEITFIDRGTRYDPLAKPDPDTTLSVKQRKKGGLGIFMVKQSMDDVKYEYRDGKNTLTILKKLN